MIEISMGSLKGQLNYYGSDHFIFDVDSAFDSKLFGNQLTQQQIDIIKKVEGVSFADSNKFLSKFEDNIYLYLDRLSTGTKAILCAMTYPNLAVPGIVCGHTAYYELLKLEHACIYFDGDIFPPRESLKNRFKLIIPDYKKEFFANDYEDLYREVQTWLKR